MTDTTHKLIADTGASFTRRPVSIESINLEESLANQVRANPLNTEVVDDYAAAMERGDVFPPIIVAEQGGQRWLLGGNHRLQAAAKASRETLDAYVVHDPTEHQAKTIAFGDNATHGQPLTNPEKLAHADYLISQGWASNTAAAHVGVSANRLLRHRDARKVVERFNELHPGEHALIRQVSAATRSRLSALRDDEVFSTVARATAAYAIPNKVVYTAVSDINRLSDVSERVEKAREFAAEHAAVGKRDRSTGRSKRTELHRLSDALIELASVDFDEAARYVKRDDLVIWERRLREAAQRCFDMKKKIGA